MEENGLAPFEGGSESASRVKTDWNCRLQILAFSLVSVSPDMITYLVWERLNKYWKDRPTKFNTTVMLILLRMLDDTNSMKEDQRKGLRIKILYKASDTVRIDSGRLTHGRVDPHPHPAPPLPLPPLLLSLTPPICHPLSIRLVHLVHKALLPLCI